MLASVTGYRRAVGATARRPSIPLLRGADDVRTFWVSTAAILLAGGSGSRLRRNENKVFVTVGGHPLITWTMRAFASCGAVDELVVVTRTGERARLAAILTGEEIPMPLRTARGGRTRSDSELSGLEALAEDIEAGNVPVWR